MKTAKRSILIAGICVVATLIAAPTFGGIKKRGSTHTTNGFEISNIESKNLEKDLKSGLIYYTFRANVRNKTSRDYRLTVCFQAVDRDGYEREEACFHDKWIERRGTTTITNKLVMDATDYNSIWEWKVESMRAE